MSGGKQSWQEEEQMPQGSSVPTAELLQAPSQSLPALQVCAEVILGEMLWLSQKENNLC